MIKLLQREMRQYHCAKGFQGGLSWHRVQGRTTKRNDNRTQESIEEYHVTSLKSGMASFIASLYISNFI